MGMLDDKVAVVTGAGGGLGRSHAHSMAREGASVVVNDLGTSVHGEETSEDLADRVVAEIEEEGGKAVANKRSVADPEGAESIVETALETFGRLDIVVNNAGILRDKTLVKMTDEMWRAVMDVHLDGTFYVTRAAMRTFQEQETGGRIINTTSFAGLKGNFGQTNYGAAKAGIAGLTRVVAMEGDKYGVTVNAIAPLATTRMTEGIESVPDEFKPEEISPLVTWLASDEAEDVTGRIFGAHGSHYFEYQMETTPGVDPEEGWSPEEVGDQFDAITTMPNQASGEMDGGASDRVRALLEALPATIREDRVGGWEATIQFEIEGGGTYVIAVADGEATFQTGGADSADGTVTFDGTETLLKMASGALDPQKAFMAGRVESDDMDILMKFGEYFDLEAAAADLETDSTDESPANGASTSDGLNHDLVGKKYRDSAQLIEAEEILTYADATENDNPQQVDPDQGEGLVAPPLFAVRLFHPLLEEVMHDEELNVDLLRLVHGEQDMTFHDTLNPKDLVVPRARIDSITETSSGELLTIHFRLMRSGELVVEADTVLFIRDDADESDESSASEDASSDESSAETSSDEREDVDEAPAPLADADQYVAADQPERYAEASGDHNPIHLDPEVAEAAGLPSVILHGLCTMAFASNAVVDELCDGDASRLRRLAVRFSKPVFPEQTITTRLYPAEDRGTYEFDAVDSSGNPVLQKGRVELREVSAPSMHGGD